MIKEYLVYYDDHLIGRLSVNENRHKYEVVTETLQEMVNAPIPPMLLTSRDWGEEIPFFKVRLEANERFPDLPIGLHTDKIRMEEV